MAEAVLLYGASAGDADLRHHVPLAVGDPFLFAELDGRPHVVTSSLERDRIAEAVPAAEVHTFDRHGYDEVLAEGGSIGEVEREVCARAVEALGVRAAIVPPTFPVALADRLRHAGIELRVDEATFSDRRRVKHEAELAGVRNAQAAAEHGMGAARQLLRDATARDGVLHRGPLPLTAEDVRERIRASCAAHGAPAPADLIVAAGAQGAAGHDPGSGPLPEGVPIIVDLWPRDEASGCHADMTRTFVVGTVPDWVAEQHRLCLEALEASAAEVRAGVMAVDVYARACDVFEAAGHPTQRTKAPGEVLLEGFFHSLGHGVGLDVHEAPLLGRAGRTPLLAGDVLAVEPGTYRRGEGGVRLEDLLLVTADGHERLTDFPYDLAP